MRPGETGTVGGTVTSGEKGLGTGDGVSSQMI